MPTITLEKNKAPWKGMWSNYEGSHMKEPFYEGSHPTHNPYKMESLNINEMPIVTQAKQEKDELQVLQKEIFS